MPNLVKELRRAHRKEYSLTITQKYSRRKFWRSHRQGAFRDPRPLRGITRPLANRWQSTRVHFGTVRGRLPNVRWLGQCRPTPDCDLTVPDTHNLDHPHPVELTLQLRLDCSASRPVVTPLLWAVDCTQEREYFNYATLFVARAALLNGHLSACRRKLVSSLFPNG